MYISYNKMQSEQLKAPSPHFDTTNLNISENLKTLISNNLSQIKDLDGILLMRAIENHLWHLDHVVISYTRFHTVMAQFSHFQEKFDNLNFKHRPTWTEFISKCMAFALRWNQVLQHNNSKSGKDLKASLACRIENLEKLLQEIDSSETSKQ